MKRLNPNDVVDAYRATNLIPIRKAWETSDARGGCAIDAVARHFADTDGQTWADLNLREQYWKGFTEAWDADKPVILDEKGQNKDFLIGYWDAILCREAVEKTFCSITDYTPEPEAPEASS